MRTMLSQSTYLSLRNASRGWVPSIGKLCFVPAEVCESGDLRVTSERRMAHENEPRRSQGAQRFKVNTSSFSATSAVHPMQRGRFSKTLRFFLLGV